MDTISNNYKGLPIVDQIRKNIAEDPDVMNTKDFMHHLITLYAAVEPFNQNLYN